MIVRASLLITLTACTTIIDHDAGGYIAERSAYIAASPSVEIRGYCASACTMHLANGCVHPTATLVFHGPITTDRFDYWSAIMAEHYPPALSDWFMTTGRFGEYTMTGQEAINMGASECQ